MKRYFAALMLVFATLLAYSQTEGQYQNLIAALRQAAAEKNDAQRLAQYDAIVRDFDIAEAPSQPTIAIPQEPSKWIFDQKVDPMTDKRRYFFILMADSGKNEYGDLPALVVRFNGEETEIYINWKAYLGNDTDDYKYEGKYITTRIDADEPSTSLWSNSTDSKASFCPWNDALGLVRRMGNGTKFVARCTPYDANPITAVFDIRGLKALSMPYDEALGWWR